MPVRLTALDPNVWVKNGSNIQQLGIFNELNSGIFLIDPAQIAALGGTKSSQLSDADFLTLRMTPSLDITAPISSHLNSAWSSNGWTVSDQSTLLNELATWCDKHFSATSINKSGGDVDLILMQGKVSNDDQNIYTVALAYLGNRGILLGGTPDTLSDLALWLDASALSLSEGATVGTWTDKSGNGRHMTTSATYLATGLNGKPTVRLMGSMETASNSYVILSTYQTMFVVGRFAPINGGSSSFKLSHFLNNVGELSNFNNTGGSFVKRSVSGTYYTQMASGVPGTYGYWTDNAPTYKTIRYNGAFTFRTRGTSFGGPYDISGSSVQNVTSPVNNYSRLIISGGTTYANPSSQDPSYVSEVILYNRALSDAEIVQVENYLASKYSITTPTTLNVGSKYVMDLESGAFYDLGVNARSETVDVTGFTISNSQKKSGSYSALAGDISTSKIVSRVSGNYGVTTLGYFQTSNFTVEGWYYFTNVSAGYQALWSRPSPNTFWGDGAGMLLMLNASNKLQFQAGDRTSPKWNQVNVTTNYTPPLNTWAHIAVVRNGNTLTIYADGVSVYSGSCSSLNVDYASIGFHIGHYPYFAGGARSMYGYIDDFRVSVVAQYTSAFDISVAFKTY